MLGELAFYISWLGTWLIFTSPIWWALWYNKKEKPKEVKKTEPREVKETKSREVKENHIRLLWVYDTEEGQKVVCLA